jgi:hypothetical protein
MAIKYSKPKKHNAGTKRTSYNNKTGRTRTTVTVKNKTTGITRSRSVNKNGSIRQTTTHKSPAGFITRTTKTFGGSSTKPSKPKFIKAPKPKKSIFRRSSGTSSGSVGKSSASPKRLSNRRSGDGERDQTVGIIIILLIVMLIAYGQL